MGLVDGEEIDAELAQRLQRFIAQQSLRRDIKQAERAILQASEDLLPLGGVDGGIERGGGDAEFAQLRDLIAHQRDERRDDEGEALAHQRRQLEQQRLAAAGRHHGEHILAREHAAEDFLLSGAEIRKTVDARQFGARALHEPGRFGHGYWLAGSKTGVHCTSSMRSAPQASMTSRSKPIAAPLASGLASSAARKSSSSG